MSAHRLKAYFYLIATSAIWGIATPVIKFTQKGIDPLPFLTYRFFAASVFGIVVVWLYAKKHQKALYSILPQIILYSLLSVTFSLGFLFIGIDKTTVVDTILITAISPLVLAIFGAYFLKERITLKEKKGMFIAFAGTLLIVAEPIFMGNHNELQLTGNILVLAYLFTNSYSAVLAKKIIKKNISPFVLSNISFIVGFLTILPITLFYYSPPILISTVSELSIPYHLGIFYMAFVSGTLAYYTWIKGQKTIEISEAGVFSYLMPIFSIPLAVFWLGESFSLLMIVSAVLILIGIAVVERK